MRLCVQNSVDGYDWLLKTGYSERTDPVSVIEDESLYGMGNWGTLNFVEVHDRVAGCRDYCVARFCFSDVTLFGFIVYYPFRDRGYASKLLDWVVSNTTVHELTTSNPVLEKLLKKKGWTFISTRPSEYDTSGTVNVWIHEENMSKYIQANGTVRTHAIVSEINPVKEYFINL